MSRYQITVNDMEYEINDGLFVDSLTAIVEATPVPYSRATRDCPAEGGFFEDIYVIKILEALDDSGNDIEPQLWDDIMVEIDDVLHAKCEQDMQQQLAEQEYRNNEAALEAEAELKNERSWN